ncbi:MAG: hypothetical protein IMF07_01820 [Proteobacteria bacterium]|nr:hypothetical protein [Pseudomonadota bacterium]
MPSVRIKKELNQGIYFLTFTVRRWYYLFDRHNRWEILLSSLRHCQEHKYLKIYSWVFMLNHLHLMVQGNDVAGFVRDFKKHTSKELKKNILATEPGILKLFEKDEKYRFWGNTNMPELIESEKFYWQKLNYIEQNPVRKRYVENPENWIYSSASKDCLLKLEKIE